MSELLCPNPIKGIDDVIAKHLGVHEKVVARWRAEYDLSHKDSPIDFSEFNNADVNVAKKAIETAGRLLKNFSNSEKEKEDNQKGEDADNEIVNPVAQFNQLKEAYPDAAVRNDRIHMISHLFSKAVDALQAAFPYVDREDLIKGFVSPRGMVGGPANIFRMIEKQLKLDRQKWSDKGYADKVLEFDKIMQNYGALCSYALFDIRLNEGMIIGRNLTFAKEINPSEFTDSEDLDGFSVEESTKEHWQELSDSIDPLGSVSKLVRQVLSRRSNEEGNIDDLGYPRKLNPVTVHQSIMDILVGINSEEDMIERLNKYAETHPYIAQILNEFRKNPILRTQFFVDFSKDFQEYSMLDRIKGIFSFKSLNNLTREGAFKRYLAALNTRTLSTDNAIFDYTPEGTIVDTEKAKNLANKIKDFLGEPETGKIINAKARINIASPSERKAFYNSVLQGLGIKLTTQEIEFLDKNPRLRSKLNKILQDLPLGLGFKVEGNKFISLIKETYGGEAKGGYLEEKLGGIFQITESLGTNKNILSRIRFQGNNYFSNVKSSYLGRFKGSIDYYARNRSMRGLQRWLEENYLEGTPFKDGNNIRNRWLKDLYTESIHDSRSFANQFTFTKFLGDRQQKFEDFGERKQLLTQIRAYSDAGTSGYAWYPVFIMGDSNASKYIRAKVYSEEDILDGIVDLYIQEKEFQKLLQEYIKGLKNKGKSAGSLEHIDKDKFGVLQFLTVPKYASMLDLSNLEESIKKAAKQYLDDSFEDFYSKAKSVGLLETTGKDGTKFKYLNHWIRYNKGDKKLTGEEAVREHLREYCWNHEFATMMQMNIMNINPIFFDNGSTITLQKRNKHIHASGDRLNIDAVDMNGVRFSNGVQRTVYFNDIKVNPENTNEEFMEVIASLHGKDSKVYKTYSRGATLTDGQGYRTLKSYRAVMGMAGKWTNKHENAYKKLQAIIAEIGRDGTPTEEQSKAISDLMLVLQPIKPFLYTHEKVGVGDKILKIPVQMKYAETVVIPELLKKGRLRSMMKWAEDKNIDVVAATTTVKVGGFGEVDATQITDYSKTTEVMSKAEVHELDYKDYVIQTNVPEHIHSSQLVGTQSRKIIMANLPDTGKYNHYIDSPEGLNLGDGKLVPLNAYNLKRYYVALNVANILEDLDKYTDMIKDPEKVRKVLTQMTINNVRETKDNLRGYSQEDAERDFLVPLFEGGIEHDTVALLLSLFRKRVNKQMILGGSAVQVSAFGINGYDENDNLKFICEYDENGKPYNILYAECEMPFDLSYTDADGNQIPLNFNDWCNPDGTLKLGKELDVTDPEYKKYQSYKDKDGKVHKPKIEEKFPDILSFIAYRIPTEEKYSMLNMKVVRFTQKVNGGGTIKVPAQGTTIAGFDFDIDKLYFMRREYKLSKKLDKKTLKKAETDFLNEHDELRQELFALKNAYSGSENLLESLLGEMSGMSLLDYKEGAREQFESWLAANLDRYTSLVKYDYTKTPWDKSQSRVARNNELINLIQKRLEDPQTLPERTVPGGFGGIKDAAKRMMRIKGIDDETLIYSNPWTMIRINQQNQIADKLIGIFANQNANHNISTLLFQFTLANSIAFGNHLDGLSDLKNPNSQTKQLLAAAVDAVKDPVLGYLNLNTITASPAALLVRLGYSFEEVSALLNQPIIEGFCKYCMDNNFKDFDSAIENVISDWGLSHLNTDKLPISNLSLESLEDNISKYAKNSDVAKDLEFKTKQLQAIRLFQEIATTASEVDRFITNTKFTAANSVKSTMGGMIAQQEKVRQYTQTLKNQTTPRLDIRVSEFDKELLPISSGKSLDSREDYIREVINNPFGYEQAMYDANVEAIKSLNRYFPYGNSSYSRLRNFMSSISLYSLDESTIDDIHKDILIKAIGNVEGSLFNPDTIKEKYDAYTYYRKVVPYKVMNLINNHPELKIKYPVLNFTLEIDEKDNHILKYGDNGALDNSQKELIRESWEALLADPELSEVAKDLYMYSYYYSGFGFGVIGFNHLAPVALKEAIEVGDESYLDFLYGVLADNGSVSSINETEFAAYFIMKHPDNSRLVYTPKKQQLENLKKLAQPNGKHLPSFEVSANDESFRFLRTKETKTDTWFMPALMINEVLYIATDGNPANTSDAPYINNKAVNGRIFYVQVKEAKQKDVSFEDVIESESQEYEGDDYSSTKIEVEIGKGHDIIFDKTGTVQAALLNAIIDTLVRSGAIMQEESQRKREDYVDMINKADSSVDINTELVKELKEICKENGVKCKVTKIGVC